MNQALANYHALVAKVDKLCSKVIADFSASMECKEGCSGCCKHITVSWVEAVALAAALQNESRNIVENLRARAKAATPDSPCPLLIIDRCSLYENRPIICRTHGFPILTRTEKSGEIDFCSLNFKGVDSIPGDAVVDIDRLNTLLESVNSLFLEHFFDTTPAKNRLSIAEALLLEIETSGE